MRQVSSSWRWLTLCTLFLHRFMAGVRLAPNISFKADGYAAA
jgi:hypothetical protein